MPSLARWAVWLSMAVGAGAAARVEQPVGMILAAQGDVFVDVHDTETPLTAAAGMMLFSGYTLRNAGGSVTFSFCPKQAAWTLAPGREVTLGGEEIAAATGALQSAAAPAFCEMPRIERAPLASAGAVPEPSVLQPGAGAELERRLAAIDRFLSTHPFDLSAIVARVAALRQLGRVADARAALRSIAGRHPEATWTRGVTLPEPPQEAGPGGEPSGKTYAVLIGISRYQHAPPIESLRYADRDAELFARLLREPRGGGLQSDQIRLLTNEQATRAAIDDAVRHFARLSAAAAQSNTLILFIAGHGVFLTEEEDPITHRTLQRNPYILTYESNPQDAKTSGYPMRELRQSIAEQASHFRRVLVLVDVCHANQIGPISSGLNLEPAIRAAFAGENGEFGMLLATKRDAFESERIGGGHGVFTYFVVDGWNGAAAAAGTKIVTFHNLTQYVGRQVPEFTNETQIPEPVDPNPEMLITPDITKAGITLLPAQPLPKEITRRLRRGSASKEGFVEDETQSGGAPQPMPESFRAAIQAHILLPEEQGSAARILAQMRAARTAPPLDEYADELRVALEDRGQQTILHYLEGDQIPQNRSEFARGARYFEEALRLAPDSAFDESRMLFCQGRALLFDHAYGEARTLLERAIRLDPSRAYAYNALGIAYLEQISSNRASFDLSLRAFHDAIRFAPYWAYPRHNLALAYAERGDYAAAIRTWQEAQALAPYYSYLPYSQGLLYQRLNDWPKAERSYRQALETAERNLRTTSRARAAVLAEIWNAMGTLDAARNRFSAAEALYRKALAINPDSRNARRNLAALLSRSGKSAEAEADFDRNLQSDPADLPTLIADAAYRLRIGEWDTARDLYLRILDLRPAYGAMRMALGGLYLRQRKPEDALREFTQALADSPRNSQLLDEIGDADAQLGRTTAAATAWREAQSLTADRAARKRLAKKLKDVGAAAQAGASGSR